MKSELDLLAEKVGNDELSGSSETTAYVLNGIMDALNGKDHSREELEIFANELSKARPAMAPLCNIADVISGSAKRPNPTADALRNVAKLMEKERTAVERIAEFSLEHIEGRIMTLSYSGTVMKAITSAAKSRPNITVVVAESLPLGEGRRTAAKLADLGIEVTLVPDSMVIAEARGSDVCIVGADAVTPFAVVNKVGTYAMALGCVQAGIPAFVLTSTLKIRSKLSPDWIVEVKGSDSIKERTQIFEPTPLELFTGFITEDGEKKARSLFD